MKRKHMANKVTVGVDYGSLSGRAVVVRVADGEILGTAVHEYRHGVMDEYLSAGDGKKLPPDWALQNPNDYVEVLQNAIPAALLNAGVDANDVIGIGTDFTACTVLPTLANGTPLCELPEFTNEPHAYVKLWKHHAAQGQADRITALAHQRNEPWIQRYGGSISSEWEFAKALQVLEEAPAVYDAMRYWVEAADWIIWQLCGTYVRNECTAGYKGILQDGTYPGRDYCAELNPAFADFVTEKLDHTLGKLGDCAGKLTEKAAAWTGLPAGIAVAVGNVDAHVTIPAANAVTPGSMVAIMGTSTCHVMNGHELANVPGMCGVVKDGITPGLWGYEAGQSGVGDIFGWFVETCVPADYHEQARELQVDLHELLTNKAAKLAVGEHGLLALDWHSGNRSTLVDHELSGLILGQTLATKPEEQYRALLEATAFGTRVIVDAFRDAGVSVEEFVIAGGLMKNHLLMQIYADVLNMPLSLIGTDQGPALGSAIHAAVAAGAYASVADAAPFMGKRTRNVYTPDRSAADKYAEIYAEYRTLYDYFGRGVNPVMHKLRALRRAALSDQSQP